METEIPEKPQIEFTDAQRIRQIAPAPPGLPTLQELQKLKPGTLVKVHTKQERFWMKIKRIEGEFITATIDTNLAYESDYHYGDTINFEKRHIQLIQKDN